MSLDEKQTIIVSAIIVGVCFLIGLSAGGYFIGKAGARFKADVRTVTVKGLVEKEVKADQAVWTLSFRRTSENLKDAHARISGDRKATIAFLKNQGFKENEISIQPIKIVDKLARDYDSGQANERYRYVVTNSVRVTTKNVDLVMKALGETEKLLKSGVLLDGQMEGMANPRYSITAFNELRPQLLAEATKNARLTAQQFASDSEVKVGKIRSANQGNIQIFGTDGNDESAYYSPTSSLVKKIRVVSTFEFELK
ncbi:MAG TPA: SIMPL domain-containing protein [Smithellaceae bacterium]|nr:SIMPL domain-containing protein [Smithellaceae bacterium]HRS90261.1 SIMPL domain-containing protein [Smithellaceae bacterium]HRV27037.1 SIMPL domain-containing protein [Smithellaceae bacterium]